MVITNVGDLKLLAKHKPITLYIMGCADMGIFQLRYDVRTDRMIAYNTSQNWAVAIKGLELFEGHNEKAKVIGTALQERKLCMLEKGQIYHPNP